MEKEAPFRSCDLGKGTQWPGREVLGGVYFLRLASASRPKLEQRKPGQHCLQSVSAVRRKVQ